MNRRTIKLLEENLSEVLDYYYSKDYESIKKVLKISDLELYDVLDFLKNLGLEIK